MLKRLLPFMLTLMVGTALGSLTNPSPARLSAADFTDREESLRDIDFNRIPDVSTARTWAIIRSQPPARYTEAARSHQLSGTVVLHVKLNSDGTITDIWPDIALPDGLTGEAIKAARQIKFTPATIDGQPVSIWTRVAYTFNGRDGDGFHGFNYATDTSGALSEDGEDWRVVYE
jgi:TonB family protein